MSERLQVSRPKGTKLPPNTASAARPSRASLNASALRYWYWYYWNLTGLLLGRYISVASFFWALRLRPVALVARTGGGMYLVCPEAERIFFGKEE